MAVVLAFSLVAANLAAKTAPNEVPQGTELPRQLKNVGIDQQLNSQLPLDAMFKDEKGRLQPFRNYLTGRPAILALVYYECPMLCTMTLNGLLRTLRPMSLNVGEHFDVIAVSFDPADTPQGAEKKRFEFVERYNRPESERGWKFLTGDEANIKRLTDAAGYRFSRDPQTGQWAHASGLVVVTPDGKVSKYFYGVEYSARDLRFSLVEASQGKVGNAVDQVLLFCFHYDPTTGKYGILITKLLRTGAALTVLGLLAFWFLNRRGRRGKYHDVERLPITS
ncbi:MAG: SCO family protein [Bryobacterales bacterium]|nr:SCO family protein [Bryobacterales bacterium]